MHPKPAMAVDLPAFPFETLEVYRLARAFRQRMYRLARQLPDAERFNLVAQIRAAARSLTNNIAEGCGRYTYRDRVYFMHQARGSLTELMDDITICEDERYAQPEHLGTLRPDALQLYRALSSYIRYLRRRHDGRKDEAPSEGAVADAEQEQTSEEQVSQVAPAGAAPVEVEGVLRPEPHLTT